ncbi:MAG: hypothetical protein S4CHLAM6_01200 [Chlamydiae bacterium]|nr:hypothetical protein [Chlamydiota bacterium]
MFRKNYAQYTILALALLIIISFPKRAQDAMRNQFFRPFIPLANISFKPARKKKILSKKIPSQQNLYQPTYPNSTLAKIVYRNPTNWNSFFWISREKNSNHIVVNSPVLYQNALVGVVDYLGKKQARVKLITNSNLTVSVRAMRGKNQYYDLINHLNALSSYNCIQSQLPLYSMLANLKTQLLQSKESAYFAKGELFGLSQPLWRANGKILLGRGFNCSTKDQLSVARELTSGGLIDSSDNNAALILPDDLLITTGFDGVFPEGLAVAKVLAVDPMEEGAYYYSLKAAPIIVDFDALNQVEVILPLNFEPEKVNLNY